MTKERQYLDFYLQLRDLDRLTQSFKVAVLPSPAVGESREATTVNYNYDELAKSLSRLEHRLIDQKSLIQFGEHLANLLLPLGEIRTLFEQVVKDAGQDGGVRLRLLTSEPKLARLPWEYTYLPLNKGEEGYRHFLILNPQISLVRHEPIAKKHPKVEGIDPKQLRLLVAMANPKKDLKLDHEKNNLTKVLEEFSVDDVTLEWRPLLENATIHDLTNDLMKKKPELFYFAGHGHFDQEGYILLQTDASGAPYSMPATQLALQLKQAGVRVAVFGTCESARRDGASEWAGVAPTLVAEGVPVVVAMQYEVLDNHAIAFSEIFYAALAAGLSVDEAVAAGRLAMLGQDASNRQDESNEQDASNRQDASNQRKLGVVSESSDSKSLSNEKPANVQWGVPVLYMRSADSIIFPRKTSAVAKQIRRVIQQNIGSIKNGSEFTGLKVKRAKGSFEFVLNIQEIDNSKVTGVKIKKS
ncbi:MAG: CHAT domain-containing protein [Nostoc sp.]|uniref:CHAT domain-containing protein n=1 Tax=Nostoc sp. TaxID=1180 RepID=UPI002FF8AEA0